MFRQGRSRKDVDAAARLAAAEGTLLGLRDAALLRLGSDAFLRISELAAVEVEHLERGHLRQALAQRLDGVHRGHRA